MKKVGLLLITSLVLSKQLQSNNGKDLGYCITCSDVAKIAVADDGDVRIRKAVLKMNLSPLVFRSLAFMCEYAINDKFSVGLGYTAVLERNLPKIFFNENVKFTTPTFKGKTITPEFRWYPFNKKKNKAPAGFYMAGYARYASYKFAQTMTYDDASTGIAVSADATHTYKGLTLGGMFGVQAIAKGGFTFDWWIIGGGVGAGSYTYSWTNISANFSQTQQAEVVQQYLDYYKNIGFIGRQIIDVSTSKSGISAKAKGLPMYSTRIMGFCLGYSF